MSSKLSSNTSSLQSVLEAVNKLPSARDVELQDKMITPTEHTQAIRADSGYHGLGQVIVEAIPDEYIITTDATATETDILFGETAYANGSKVTGSIATKTLSDVTMSCATVTVPSGYYRNEIKRSVSTATQATPSIRVNSNGLITATVDQTVGYVSVGTRSSTYQLAFQTAKTITPSIVSQIAVSSGYYTGGDITVDGDSNLVAKNIRNGIDIFGVSGTLEENSESGEQSGWSEKEDAIIRRTISGVYINDAVEFIGSYAFCHCSSLTTASFPVCTRISGQAFQFCYNLTTASFPVCTRIGYWAFRSCSSLTTASFPACTSIGSSAFYECSSLTTASFPVCTTIGAYAFDYCYSLTTASFPVCTNIGYRAFAFCSSLTTASFPACTSISSDVFYRCYNLTTASFPACTNIGAYAFYYCSSLTTASFPVCTSIGEFAFDCCRSLTTVSFPVCTSIEGFTFAECRSLTTVSFPACTSIGNYAFSACVGLTTVSFPVCTSIGYNAFEYCISLTTASFPVCTSISSYVFYRCYNLSALQLGASSVCTLSNSNAFSSTPFAGYSSYFSGTPHIYVPSSLITAYQSATNWTYFSSYFSAIESLPITFTIDGVEYQADYGMTWSEWINSDYNQHPTLSIDGNTLKCKTCGHYLEWAEDDPVFGPTLWEEGSTSIIVQNREYSLCDCKTITFTLNGAKYQAENGMTWEEWLNSEYSQGHSLTTTSLGMLTCAVCGDYLGYMVGMASFFVYTSDTIIANTRYATCTGHLITFTINGVEYQAEEGMTWSEWVESEYSKNCPFDLDATATFVGCSNCYEMLWYASTNDEGSLYTINVESDDAIIENQGYNIFCECEPTIITFSIAGGYGDYQAEEGMTFGEWVNSEYNVDGFIIQDGELQPPTTGGASGYVAYGDKYEDDETLYEVVTENMIISSDLYYIAYISW